MKKELLLKKNVVLVYTGRKVVGGLDVGRPAIRVGVTKKLPLTQLKPDDQIPKTFEGMETDVYEDKMPKALRTGRYRPMPGGVSGGHPAISAGTLSPMTIHGVKYIISNAHVLANSNDADLGDQTWQPGAYDGGQPSDTIGHLLRWVPIHFEDDESTCPIANMIIGFFNFLAELFHRHSRLCTKSLDFNIVDAALSRAIDDNDLSDEILDIGVLTGFAEAHLSDSIKKSGRTTAVTHGTVLDTEGAAKVDYGSNGVAMFEDQIITTKIAEGGDSGSLVLNDRNEIVGLLFAGGDTMTIVNKISNVIDALA